MKGWAVAGLLVMLAVIFVINRASEAENKRLGEASKRAEQRAQVDGLAQRWRADKQWESKLAGPGGYRTSEVMSVELQRLWLGQPILFVGTLEDISKLRDGSYHVTAEHDGLISSQLFIMSSFGVRVACPEEVGKKLLDAHTKESFAMYSGVALVVQINEIIQERATEEDGTSSLTRIGIGKCFDAIYLGSNRIWENQ